MDQKQEDPERKLKKEESTYFIDTEIYIDNEKNRLSQLDNLSSAKKK